jgi:hypothetical protein
LDEVIGQNFSPDTVKKKTDKLRQSKRYLEEERAKIQRELDKMLQIQANREVLEESVNDLRKLSRSLVRKLKTMPLIEKKRLMEYLVPDGQFIEIYPIGTLVIGGRKKEGPGPRLKKHRRKQYHYEFNGRKRIIKWEYEFAGLLNVRGLVQALKDYDEYGTITSVQPINDRLIEGTTKNV